MSNPEDTDNILIVIKTPKNLNDIKEGEKIVTKSYKGKTYSLFKVKAGKDITNIPGEEIINYGDFMKSVKPAAPPRPPTKPGLQPPRRLRGPPPRLPPSIQSTSVAKSAAAAPTKSVPTPVPPTKSVPKPVPPTKSVPKPVLPAKSIDFSQTTGTKFFNKLIKEDIIFFAYNLN